MQAQHAFSAANGLMATGWLALAISLFAPAGAARIGALWGGRIVPALLAIAYGWAAWQGRGAPGGFDSLAAVGRLFEHPSMLLAGWLHYLAFDLFVGHWQVQVARREAWPLALRVLLLAALALTLWAGPLGLLLFFVLAAALRLSRLHARRSA